MKKFLIKISLASSLIFIGIIPPLLLYELGIRTEHYFRKGTPFLLNPSSRWDKTLGWLGKEHKLPGNDQPPILVIGDSFTEGLGLASEKIWFASLKQEFPEKTILAYAGMGYGTLQELLVLQKYLAQGIEPDLIIIQLCSNDIINNYFPLEKASLLQRAPAPRPYLSYEGNQEFRFPRKYDWLITPLISISRLADKFETRLEAKLSQQAGEHKITTIEDEINSKGFGFPLFREAVSVTDQLFWRIKQAAGSTRVILMSVDNSVPSITVFKQLARKHSIPLIIPLETDSLPDNAKHQDGAHFNDLGNKILGDRFVELAKKRGFLEMRKF